MPFLCKTMWLSTRHETGTDDRSWTLEAGDEPFAFYSRTQGATFRARVKSTTDGLSAPQFAQSLLPRTGKYLFEAAAHDFGYRGCLEQQAPDGHWFAPSLRRADWDLVLRELLLDAGCPADEAEIIYEAVRRFGAGSLEQDLTLPIPK